MDRPQRLAQRQEQLTAQLHGGRVTPASGSGSTVKNDVRNDDWSIEVKSTSAKSYSLSKDVLAAAEKNALSDGRKMALVVSFVPPRSTATRATRYVVLSEDDFLELTQHTPDNPATYRLGW